MPKTIKKRIEWGLGDFYICAECGKKFYITSFARKDYLYKKNKDFFCSNHCFNVNSKK